MTKADIVSEISKATGIDKASVLETVEKFMETVKDSLSHNTPKILYKKTKYLPVRQIRCSWNR